MTNVSDVADQITRLAALRQSGAFSDAEFGTAKANVLKSTSQPPPASTFAEGWGSGQQRDAISTSTLGFPPAFTGGPELSASTLPAGAWLAIVAGAFMALGGFLPWGTANTVLLGTINRNAFQLGNNFGFSIDGVIALGLGIVTAIIGVTRLTKTAMPRYLQRSPLVTGIVAVILVIVDAPGINSWASQLNNSSGATSAGIGYGLWLVAFAGALAVVAGLTPRSRAAK